MAKKGERLGSTDDGRVLSEHLTVSLKRGQRAAVSKAAKASGRSVSQEVQQALESWVFRPRGRSGAAATGARKRPKNVK